MEGKVRSRTWCGTWNNYSDEDYDRILNDDKWRYIVVGKETAPATGTRHLQLYCVTTNPVWFSALKREYPECHWEKAKGNYDQNHKYCTKEGNYEERGIAPTVGGHLAGIVDDLHLLEDIMTRLDKKMCESQSLDLEWHDYLCDMGTQIVMSLNDIGDSLESINDIPYQPPYEQPWCECNKSVCECYDSFDTDEDACPQLKRQKTEY